MNNFEHDIITSSYAIRIYKLRILLRNCIPTVDAGAHLYEVVSAGEHLPGRREHGAAQRPQRPELGPADQRGARQRRAAGRHRRTQQRGGRGGHYSNNVCKVSDLITMHKT